MRREKERVTRLAETYLQRCIQLRKNNATYRKKIKRLNDSRPDINSLLNVRRRLKIDQLTALGRKSSRGMKWSQDVIRDALVLKMKMGTRAYADFVKSLRIYFSVRKLQQAVEHMQFDSGIQYPILEAMKADFSRMPLIFVSVLGMDEMAIQTAEVYDPGAKR